jgi:hypothetical protein
VGRCSVAAVYLKHISAHVTFSPPLGTCEEELADVVLQGIVFGVDGF